jgi:microcystin-dependent protein
MILADFDAVTAVINGGLDTGNMSSTGVQSVLLPGDLVVSAAASRAGCLLCDGSPVSRVTYSALYAAIGVAFGAGDGTSTFNLPDYRGRTIVGADPSGVHMGTNHPALGASGGEENHSLLWQESGTNSNGVTGNENAYHQHADSGHSHGITVNANNFNHRYVAALDAATWGNLAASGGALNYAAGSGGNNVQTGDSSHTHSASAGTGAAVIGNQNAFHQHALVARNADWAHNNVQPFAAANVFIKT